VIQIDSLGKTCPQPIIDLARALRNFPEVDEFQLLSDDVATSSDLTAWSRMTGHEVEEVGVSTFLIRRVVR